MSHSQWDIVSLLLDSKVRYNFQVVRSKHLFHFIMSTQVCYPQLRNKAGYSPPMLAALAQPTNNTESQVLQRLFSLCDVNSKATQVRLILIYPHDNMFNHLNGSIIARTNGFNAFRQPWKSRGGPSPASRRR